MKTLKFFFVIGLLIPWGVKAQQISVASSSSTTYAYATKDKSSLKLDDPEDPQDQDANVDAQRSKKISKTFNVDRNDKVIIDNQYGAILIKTWNRNEVKVDVDINAYSNSEGDAQKLIDGVSVEGNKSGSDVVFKTSIADRNNNFGNIIRNGIVKKRREVKVNYVIYMPSNNALQLSQIYGNIEIGDFNGPTALRLQYGALKAGVLNNNNNYINIQYGKAEIEEITAAVIKHSYGSGLSIKEIGSLDLNASYVGIKIGTIKKSAKIVQEYGSGINIGHVMENVNVDAQYAKIILGTVRGNATIKSEYGDITASSLNVARINTDYATVSIGALNGDANIKMTYNSLSIGAVNQSCRSLVFEGDYTNVNMGFASQFGGGFTVENAYGHFSGGLNVTSRVLNSNSTKKEYRGKIGTGAPSNISIISAYGNVNFK